MSKTHEIVYIDECGHEGVYFQGSEQECNERFDKDIASENVGLEWRGKWVQKIYVPDFSGMSPYDMDDPMYDPYD